MPRCSLKSRKESALRSRNEDWVLFPILVEKLLAVSLCLSLLYGKLYDGDFNLFLSFV
jgi:hypothetical protein